MTKSPPPNVKLISLGDPKSGKSCIIKRFCEKRYVPKYLQTIGIDYGTTTVYNKQRPLKLHIFDTGGHRVFKEIRQEFYENTQAILLTFSMKDKKSFENMKSYWVNEIEENLGDFNIENIVIVVCATHSAEDVTEVDNNEARLWTEQRPGWKYFETDCRTGDNVAECFSYIFGTLLDMLGNNGAREIEEQIFTKEQLDAVEQILKGKDGWAKMNMHPTMSKDAVKKTYKTLAKLIHPDKCKVPGTEDAFKELVKVRTQLLKSCK